MLTIYWVNQPFVAVDKATGATVRCLENPHQRVLAPNRDQAKSIYQNVVVVQYEAIGMHVPGFYGRADVIEAGPTILA